MQAIRVHAVVGAALCALVAGCSQGPSEPTRADEDAYVRAVFEAGASAARQDGHEPTKSVDEAIASLTPSQRAEGVAVGMRTCDTLRESVDDEVDVIQLARAMAADRDSTADPLDQVIVAVQHLCPDLDGELDELLAALAAEE